MATTSWVANPSSLTFFFSDFPSTITVASLGVVTLIDDTLPPALVATAVDFEATVYDPVSAVGRVLVSVDY